MFSFFKKIYTEKQQILIDEELVDVKIYHESRKNSRVSLGENGINIRLPYFLAAGDKQRQIDKFIDWAKTQWQKKQPITGRQFQDGEQLSFFDTDIFLRISSQAQEKIIGKEQGNSFAIFLPETFSSLEKNEAIKQVLVKLLRKKYQAKIEAKLHRFNSMHKFGKLNRVSLKNNSTNWGSCSSKGNINISVRLFFAPEEVVDYVLIHELAHLQEQNHGVRFWRLVADACPDFKKHERWLKQNAQKCVI